MNKDYIVLGKITGHFGVKGWVKIKSYTRPVEHILDFSIWNMAAGQVDDQDVRTTDRDRVHPVESESLVLTEGRKQGQIVIASLENIGSREDAESVIGKSILVPQNSLEGLAAGEYYWSQLIGLKVRNTDGIDFGRIDHLLETGANDVMVVIEMNSTPPGPENGSMEEHSASKPGIERLLPWTNQVVVKVDLEQGTMLVDWDVGF